jgi:hypothetical protein
MKITILEERKLPWYRCFWNNTEILLKVDNSYKRVKLFKAFGNWDSFLLLHYCLNKLRGKGQFYREFFKQDWEDLYPQLVEHPVDVCFTVRYVVKT